MDLTSFERSLILCLTHLWIGPKKFLTHNFAGFPAEPTEWMLCASPSGGSGGVIYIALPPTQCWLFDLGYTFEFCLAPWVCPLSSCCKDRCLECKWSIFEERQKEAFQEFVAVQRMNSVSVGYRSSLWLGFSYSLLLLIWKAKRQKHQRETEREWVLAFVGSLSRYPQ